MTRKKVKLAFIANDSSRKATYNKRKKGMLKKIGELSTLCGIEACAIIYGLNEAEPVIWPSEEGVQRVLGKFRTMPELEQSKKMLDQEGFIGQRIVKGSEQVMKLMKENRENEMTLFMYQCLNEGRVVPDDNMTMTELNHLSKIIDENLMHVSQKLGSLNVNEEEGEVQAPSVVPPPQMEMPAAVAVPKSEEIPKMNYGIGGLGRNVNPIMMPRPLFMVNGNNGVGPIMPPFGGPVNLQPGFCPNLGMLP